MVEKKAKSKEEGKIIEVKVNGGSIKIGERAIEMTGGVEFKEIVKDLKRVTKKKIFKEKENEMGMPLSK